MALSRVRMTINGAQVDELVEPRTHLADFLREQGGLTGTNLGCEHGVCGACTLEIDGAPARSCITFAASCDGSAVRTIEGFVDDPVMAALLAQEIGKVRARLDELVDLRPVDRHPHAAQGHCAASSTCSARRRVSS